MNLKESATIRHYLNSNGFYRLSASSDQILLDPVDYIFRSSGNHFRAESVQLAFSMAGGIGHEQSLSSLSHAIEILQAGTLVIDDVQDQSIERRGQKSLYQEYGTNVAINTGNWLYFWPYEILSKLEIADSQKLKLYALLNEAYIEGHRGQGLDLSCSPEIVPPAQWNALALDIISLKTGALFALSMGWGATLAGVSEEEVSKFKNFGRELGVFLQSFDDIGNLYPQAGSKRFEDLYNKKLNYVVGSLKEFSSKEALEKFLPMIHEPRSQNWESYFSHHSFLEEAKEAALKRFYFAWGKLKDEIVIAPEFLEKIETLIEAIRKKYVGK